MAFKVYPRYTYLFKLAHENLNVSNTTDVQYHKEYFSSSPMFAFPLGGMCSAFGLGPNIASKQASTARAGSSSVISGAGWCLLLLQLTRHKSSPLASCSSQLIRVVQLWSHE